MCVCRISSGWSGLLILIFYFNNLCRLRDGLG